MIENAIRYLKSGFSVIPVDRTKQPTIREWGKYQISPMSLKEAEIKFKNAYGIALVMGGVHSLTAIDWDLKYCLVSGFYEEVKSQIPVSILQKMYVQKTMNGGFHWVFKCAKVEGNMKLASRYTTAEEKDAVYKEAFVNPVTRQNALKIALSNKSKILIETRGEGGYILIPPTPGYEKVYGEFQEITEEEYEQLMTIIRSYNEVVDIKKDYKIEKYRNKDINPFEAYCDRGNSLDLLLKFGWSIVQEGVKSVRLKHPGAISTSSALYDKETKILNVFSTSTIFDTGRGYSPASLFTELEADGDSSLAYQLLIEQGYGE